MRIVNRNLLSKFLVVLGWTGVFIILFHLSSVFDSKPVLTTVQDVHSTTSLSNNVPAGQKAVVAESKISQSAIDLAAKVELAPQQPLLEKHVPPILIEKPEWHVPVPANPIVDPEHPKPDRPAHDHEHNFVVRPFDPGSAKLVILLAYQRVGSTFIGEMFNKNAGVSYSYEPLDATYMHMYGTKEGWAVPMDLHYYWNGTYRPVPTTEQQIVSDHLEKILTCDFDNVMTEFLIHRFWQGFSRQQTLYDPYNKCLKSKAKDVSLTKCQTHIQRACKARVGQDLTSQKHCFKELINETTETPFKTYKSCLVKAREAIKLDCLPKLQSLCDSKSIRAIKTVRLDMDTIERLVDKYPNLRIIHLIRDPRPVVLSRMKAGWATLGSTKPKNSQDLIKNKPPPKDPKRNVRRSQETQDSKQQRGLAVLPQRRLFSVAENNTSDENAANLEKELDKEMEKAEKPPNDFAKEAKLYCDLVLRDMHTRQRIETKHKGTTYQMIYEHMVYHPLHEVERVYAFLNEPIPDAVQKWAGGTYIGAKDSKAIAQKWQDQMTVKTAKQIDSFCSKLYEEIEFAWPDSD